MRLIFLIVMGVVALVGMIVSRVSLGKIKKERSLGRLLEFYAAEEMGSAGEDDSCTIRHSADYTRCIICMNGETIVSDEHPEPTLTLSRGLVVPHAYSDFVRQIMSDPSAWGDGIRFAVSGSDTSESDILDISVAVNVDYDCGSPQDFIRGYVDFLLEVRRNLSNALVKYRREIDAAATQSGQTC